MWNYEKRLQYPVKISQPNAKAAQIIISQFGGPDGELVDNSTDHFHVSEFFCTDVGQKTSDFAIRHGVALRQISHGSSQFTVWSTELAYDNLCSFRIGLRDFYRVL